MGKRNQGEITLRVRLFPPKSVLKRFSTFPVAVSPSVFLSGIYKQGQARQCAGPGTRTCNTDLEQKIGFRDSSSVWRIFF